MGLLNWLAILWLGVAYVGEGEVLAGGLDGLETSIDDDVVAVEGRRRGDLNGAFTGVSRRRRLGSRSSIAFHVGDVP